MALEPAGVSLEAKGFNDYIKRLNQIDKTQQEIFDVDSRQTTKAFNEATKAADRYEKELKQVSQTSKQVKSQQQQFSKALANFGAVAITAVTGQVARFTIENAKLAAQFKSQQTGLNNLAASFGQSGSQIQSAIQSASRGTISGLQAIEAANQALLLGVAKTPEEFDKLTRTALTLGRTMGLTGTQSIDQFTTALGRRSLLILDNFGISAKAVNAEVEQLAQQQFGMMNSQLNEAQKNAIFMEAALNVAGKAAAAIGEGSGSATESFERLAATSENLRVTFGELARPLATGIADALSRAATTAQQFFAFLSAGFAGVGTVATGVIDNIGRLFRREATRSFDEILQDASRAAADRFKEVASTIQGVSFPDDEIKATTRAIQEQEQAAKNDADEIKALSQAIQQAEQLQLSFARASEDAARALARQQEDVARNQARQVGRLDESQAKDRAKLLDDQVKELENFDKNRKRQIANAEKEIAKERQKAQQEVKQAREKADRDRIRAQEKLQLQLKQAQDRFNLSRLQSERRFSLSEKRLRAEGDILALQQLREDQELARQEEKENFALQQKETKDNAKDSAKDQQQDIEDKVRQINQDAKTRLNDLKANLEQQRAELLANFDQQIADQIQAQAEAKAEQQRGFEEQAEDRAIALQRQEEDRRISQQRQLEDLGRSLANQKGVTEEGVTAIAGEFEKIFGIEGAASTIIGGFTARTESDFRDLLESIQETVSEISVVPVPGAGLNAPITTRGGRVLPGFQEGGVVPGPVGSSQIVQAHGGETILPTHKQSFIMPAPVVPSQTLSVEMSGGFNISGGERAPEGAIEASVEEMTETIRIAVGRIARRTNG